MNDLRPRPFPLYAKILLLFALNVALLGLALGLLVRAQFGLGRDWPLSSGANNRIDSTCDLILGELNSKEPGQWDEVLRRFDASYQNRAQFLVFAEGAQKGGPAVDLPPEVRQRLGDRRGPPLPRREPPPPMDGPPPGLPRIPFPPRDPRPKTMVHTGDPSRYWVVVRGAVLRPHEDHPQPVALVVMSDSLSGGGLFFDLKPWLIIGAGSLLLSALLWLPLALGINRSISQMTRATAQLAEGRFDVRVNERRRDELGALGHAINQMASRLAGLVGGQKRFLGDVAHELCSPLAKLRVALGILEQQAGGEQRAYVAQADEQAERMAALVNELLSFSKTALGASQVKLRPVAVAEVVAEAVRREQKGETPIRTAIAPGCLALAEPELLTRALGNLLRNAITYAGAAGPIEVAATMDGDHVLISVDDAGPGAPEAELEKIFDPFYRLDPSRNRATGGVGLGLAIVKTCVEACGGTVQCRNRAPTGLQATIRLAAAPRQ
ncbi:MAG TPA: HAMP domain-containing sensor histidine kinase [Verrucomicrobiae bacterium]|jgi:two-component system sensor histidine kinase CpxA|nr:HAMP domain-containing sensor histidine kinase [Verrucomicrobiae bacterium]